MYANLRFYKIIKIPSLVDVRSVYQLLHSQVYHNGLKQFLMLQFVLRLCTIPLLYNGLEVLSSASDKAK